MGQQTIAIADKPTLDEVKATTTDINSKCDTIIEKIGGQSSALNNVRVFVLDYINDPVTVTRGAIDGTRRIATT